MTALRHTFLATALLVVAACALAQGPVLRMDSLFTGEALSADLDELNKLLREIHPDPWVYCNESEFNGALERLRQDAQAGMTYQEFGFRVSELLFLLKDSHTLVNYQPFLGPYRADNRRFSAFSVYSTDSAIYVKRDVFKRLPRGSKLIAINGIDARYLHNEVARLATREGDSPIGAQRVADELFINFVGLPAKYSGSHADIQIETLEGKSKVVRYPLKTSQEVWRAKRNAAEEVHSLAFYDDGKRAVVKVGSFDYRGSSHFNRFLKQSFKEIRKAGCTDVAIDLRDNTGGRSNRVEDLFSYFASNDSLIVPKNLVVKQSKASFDRFEADFKQWQRKLFRLLTPKDSESRYYLHIAELPIGERDTVYFTRSRAANARNFFDGKLALFTNGLSGSASANFTATYRKFNLGPIYGEPCLGPISGTWGNPVPVRLRNSQLPLMIASLRFNLDDRFDYRSTEAIPVTHKIAITGEDFARDRDPVIEQWLLDCQSQGR